MQSHGKWGMCFPRDGKKSPDDVTGSQPDKTTCIHAISEREMDWWTPCARGFRIGKENVIDEAVKIDPDDDEVLSILEQVKSALPPS